MTQINDPLTNIRSLLLLWPEVTNAVDDRIRPNGFHSSDELEAAVMLELQDGRQQNVLERSCAIIEGTLVLTIRAELASDAAAIAESIRSRNASPSTGLDGYSGSAGTGTLISAERESFSTGAEVDTNGGETGLYISIQVYQIIFQIGG